MTERSRKRLMIALLLAFAIQVYFVYSDETGRKTPPLTEQARRGWQVWHENNCQSCHQMYGFGGFLGSDLTNAAFTITDTRLETILTEGGGQMPAFHLSKEDQQAIKQFLIEFDRTGIGQLKAAKRQSAKAILDALVERQGQLGAALSVMQEKGRSVLQENSCIECHLPNLRSTFRASDLTDITERLDREKVIRIIREGVLGKNMPGFNLSDSDVESVYAYLKWMSENSSFIREGFKKAQPENELSITNLPWFEY